MSNNKSNYGSHGMLQLFYIYVGLLIAGWVYLFVDLILNIGN